MNLSDKVEAKLKAKKENISKKDYTTPKEENKPIEVKNKPNITQNVTNSTPIKKRGDYKDWEENWRISDNPILKELEKSNTGIWINEKGNYVFKDYDDDKMTNIYNSSSTINKLVSSLLKRQVFIASWKDNNKSIKPSELINLISSSYRPDIKKRFFYIQKGGTKKWYMNNFTPTKYMNYTDIPISEPKTIFRLIKHLVNYKEERFYYFLNWFAYYWITFKKPQTAIVFKGVEGAGKGTFANEIICKLFGKNQVSTISDEILESRFKANKFANKSFYIFEETSKGERKSNKNVKNFLKQIITNEIVPMEEKGIKAKDIKVMAPSIFFTNETKFLEIESSDRRFSVFTTGGNIEEIDFFGYGSFNILANEIEKELPDFARYLYNFKVNVRLANKPMNTPEKNAIINLTTTSYEKFLNAIKKKNLEFFDVLLDSDNTDDTRLFTQIKDSFNKGKIERALLTKIFNAIYKKNIRAGKLLNELKAIKPEFFNKKKC